MKPSELPEFRARIVPRFAEHAEHRRETTAHIAKLKASAARRSDEKAPDLRARIDALEGQEEAADLKVQSITIGPPRLESHWQLAELFYVSAEMSALASDAAGSMPQFDLHPSDLPSEAGIIFFDDRAHVDGAVIGFVLWGPDWSRPEPGVELSVYVSRSREDLILIYQIRLAYGSDVAVEEIIREDVNVSHNQDDAKDWAKVVRCTWLLMQQRIATVETHRPDRASARRLARAGQAVDPVRVIQLRRTASVGHGDSGREYVHRWVVRGHWRKQWYPSQDRHVPLWIHPFVKGPEDAPLLGGEKVYAWTR